MGMGRRKQNKYATRQDSQILSKRAIIDDKIAEENSYLEAAYLKIGEAFYAEMQEKGVPDDYKTLFDEVARRLISIDDYRRQIHALNEIIICPQCGCESENGSQFCYSCGFKFAESEKGPQTSSRCPKCGEVLPPDAIFCPNCGVKI